MSKLVSETFKEKMLRLSGVDLIAEEKKVTLQLIKESNFLSESVMLEEGVKDIALGLLATLITLGASAQTLKPELLKTDLKNKAQVAHFEKKLEQKLDPAKLHSKEFANFKQHLHQLGDLVGKREVNKTQHTVTRWKDVKVHESNLTFDLTNPEAKNHLDQILATAKKGGGLVISIDTLGKMIQVAPPQEQAKLDTKVKVSNQGFKNYNNYEADQAVVDSIANQIISTFEGYKNVTGYIQVTGSASHVPTTAFGGSNDSLAKARACAFSHQLSEKLPENLKDKILVDFKVDGPEYEHDANDTAKYAPFQFSNVDIHLTAVKSVPVVNNPQKLTVNVKYLTTDISGNTKKLLSASLQGGKKGNLSVVCPLNTMGKKHHH